MVNGRVLTCMYLYCAYRGNHITLVTSDVSRKYSEAAPLPSVSAERVTSDSVQHHEFSENIAMVSSNSSHSNDVSDVG